MELEIGKRLIELRKREGFSQEQLGRAIGVSRQTVSKWELGESIPDTENVMQLSKLYQVTTDFLLFGESTENPTSISEAIQEKEVLEQSQEKQIRRKRTNKILLISGIVTGSIGALGILVIWVLSTMIKSWDNYAASSADGMTWHYYSGSGYSFSGFVECYRLEALLGIFVFCLLTAALLLVIRQLGKHLD